MRKISAVVVAMLFFLGGCGGVGNDDDDDDDDNDDDGEFDVFNPDFDEFDSPGEEVFRVDGEDSDECGVVILFNLSRDLVVFGNKNNRWVRINVDSRDTNQRLISGTIAPRGRGRADAPGLRDRARGGVVVEIVIDDDLDNDGTSEDRCQKSYNL